MTANHDTPEAVEAMAANLRFFPIQHRERTAAMLRRLHQRAVDAEAKVACCRASNTGYLVENDALRFERNNLRAALEPRKPWEVLREAADIIARESGHTEGGAAFDFLTFEAARLEAAAAPKVPTLAEAVRAYVRHDIPNEGWSDEYNAMMEALARAEKGA